MNRRWSEADEALLRELYPSQPAKVLVDRLGRTHSSIRQRALLLHLRKDPLVGKHRHDEFGCRCVTPGRRCWTADDIADLSNLYSRMPLKRLAKRLGRSEIAVSLKACDLGIRKIEGGMTASQVAEVFGLDGRTSHAVREWLDAGLLKGRRLKWRNKGGFIWLVDEDDLRRFIREYPWMYDRSRMPDSVYRDGAEQWVSLADAFRAGAPWPATVGDWVAQGRIPEARRRKRVIYIPESLVPQLASRAVRPELLFRDEFSVIAFEEGYKRRDRRRSAA